MPEQEHVSRQPDHQASDPWGLPTEHRPPAEWPDEEQPEEEALPEAPEEDATPEQAPEEEPVEPKQTEEAWDHAEEQATPEDLGPDDFATEEPSSEEPGLRRGPLSQALAAAQSVISSLGDPPTPHPDEGHEEGQKSAAGEDIPPSHDLPDEPPPWMEEETEDAADSEVVVSMEETAEEEAGGLPEGETSQDVLAAEEEPLPEAGGPEVDDTDQLVRELSELAEEKVVEEMEVETTPVSPEDAPAEPAAHQDEQEELEVQPSPEPVEPAADQTDHEEARAEEEAGPEPEGPALESEAPPESVGEEADTTPAAYAELAASMVGNEQGEQGQEAASSMAPAVEWGALWRESAQGWVEDDEGGATWRPIVATTSVLSDWEVDTYLGVVAGETVMGAHAGKEFTSGIRSLVGARGSSYEKDLARGRAAALRAMVDDAVARGAHAVVGVEVGYTHLGAALLVTASGTAVTLKSKP